MDNLYSSHVFVFPFRFKKVKEQNKKTKKESLKKESFANDLPAFMEQDVRVLDGGADRADYNISKYFNDAAKRAIFTTSFDNPASEIVLNYKCNFDKLAALAEFRRMALNLSSLLKRTITYMSFF
jgi:hypothetical protein